MMQGGIVPRSRDEFVAAMEQFRNGTNESLVDVFLEQGALCCRDSMVFTPPIVKAGGDGMSKEAKAAGEMAIQRDIKSDIFNKPTLESREQVRQVHETFKKRFGGRIVKNGGPGIEFWNRTVVKDQVLEAYIKERIKMVGRIKAGWVDTLNKLPKPKFKMGSRSRANAGRSQIPLWIKRHAKSDGYVQMSRREVSELVFELTLGNRIGDLDFVATDADTKNLVYGNRVKQMPLMLENMLAAHTERFNRRHKL